jgi:hypothetical protein
MEDAKKYEDHVKGGETKLKRIKYNWGGGGEGQVEIGQRPSGMEEDCIGRKGTLRIVVLEEEEEEKKKKKLASCLYLTYCVMAAL